MTVRIGLSNPRIIEHSDYGHITGRGDFSAFQNGLGLGLGPELGLQLQLQLQLMG